jgi:hypothetical protein
MSELYVCAKHLHHVIPDGGVFVDFAEPEEKLNLKLRTKDRLKIVRT